MTTNPTTNDTLTSVPGFHVGHQTDLDAATGCTVILCPPDTVGVVATNARLTKDAANLVAQMAHDGLARAINPAHTLFDGDIIFTLASGTALADVNLVGALAAEVIAAAIRRGALAASTLGGIRAASDKLPLSH